MATIQQNDNMAVKGSCACGKVTFTVSSKPSSAGTVYCYCTTCRKCSGNSFLPFVHFDKDAVDWTGRETLQTYQKSSEADRTHCSSCGSCIAMQYKTSSQVALVLGTIDQGIEVVEPVSLCIFVAEKPDWALLPEGVKCFDEWHDEHGT